MPILRFALRFTLCFAVAVSIAAPAAAQQAGVSFVAEPAPGSQTAPDGGYFVLESEPGAEVKQSIGVRNDGPEPLDLRLAAVDVVTGQLGGASYGIAGDERPGGTGGWITLERTEITVAPKESAVVSFTVAVPADADAGQHLAGISIAAPRDDAKTNDAGSGRARASVSVHTRRVIAVQIELPGQAEPELAVTGVSPTARPDGVYLEIAVENTGQTFTRGSGRITVSDGFEQTFEIDTFLPRTSIAYPIKWTESVEDGTHEVQVEITYGDQRRVAHWQGGFAVGEQVRADLADRQVERPSDVNDPGEGMPVPALIGGGAAALVTAGWAVGRVTRPRANHLRKR